MVDVFLNQILNVRKLALNNEKTFQLNDSNCDWLKFLLSEIEQLPGSSQDPPQDTHKDSYLNIDIKIVKKDNSELLEHIFLEGSIDCFYKTSCIRCLNDMNDSFTIDFKACFIPKILEKNEIYADQLTIYANSEEMELYFYEEQIIDLKEFFHEQISLNINQFPLHSEECKGMCQVCGENLNEKICVHQQENCCTL
ncbi:MAG: DUF177 domain-containing protein [Oligoflexia bacterium]|nr:DUF177 domain-containing protein [Oligoflexia bacterium]